jgi:hypothetical protein
VDIYDLRENEKAHWREGFKPLQDLPIKRTDEKDVAEDIREASQITVGLFFSFLGCVLLVSQCFENIEESVACHPALSRKEDESMVERCLG